MSDHGGGPQSGNVKDFIVANVKSFCCAEKISDIKVYINLVKIKRWSAFVFE